LRCKCNIKFKKSSSFYLEKTKLFIPSNAAWYRWVSSKLQRVLGCQYPSF